MIDLDIDFVDFPPLKDKISQRERKKLVIGLEKYSGTPLVSKPELSRASVPTHMISAFPKDKLCLTSTESILDYRKIRDIPKIVYETFRNSFLGEKSGKMVSRGSATTNASDNMHGISQSFDNIAARTNSTKSRQSVVPTRPPPAPPTIITLNSDSDIGRDSFLVVSRTSETKEGDIKNSSSPLPSMTASAVPSAMTSAATSPVHPGRLMQRTPSFFERLFASSSAALQPQPITQSVLEVSSQAEDSELLEEYVKETFEKVIHQDGHELHQLLCHLGSSNNIDNVDQDDYVDRFTTYSYDSEDVSKSESGTAQNDSKSVLSTRSQRGQKTSKTWEVFGRKKAENPKIEKIRKTCKPECALCCAIFDFRVDDAFMCKSTQFN